jgi:UDP-N-acetylglucosamine 4,6-dehydratase
MDDMYVVQPSQELWFGMDWAENGKQLADGFRYASNTNEEWLDVDQIREIVAPIEAAYKDGTLA